MVVFLYSKNFVFKGVESFSWLFIEKEFQPVSFSAESSIFYRCFQTLSSSMRLTWVSLNLLPTSSPQTVYWKINSEANMIVLSENNSKNACVRLELKFYLALGSNWQLYRFSLKLLCGVINSIT